ncbi:unnamed protein product [Symbiodinium sp. CCMP2592]|nr:unnamed protein product [Symbiodinium sp. CCMP2592]CAE7477395.1 unnamed protein product [Symbiodinium sp. CCMP2592]CAE7734090.1 unnamed protein product [Symbiodinium sp. CCMP2592]CAE7768052.1 unnamed protein product [Symbiodinium sp. CCMP2592]
MLSPPRSWASAPPRMDETTRPTSSSSRATWRSVTGPRSELHHVESDTAWYLGGDGRLRSVATAMVVGWCFMVSLWVPGKSAFYSDMDDIPSFAESKKITAAIKNIQTEAERRPMGCIVNVQSIQRVLP